MRIAVALVVGCLLGVTITTGLVRGEPANRVAGSQNLVEFTGEVQRTRSYWDGKRNTVMSDVEFLTDRPFPQTLHVLSMGGVLENISIFALGQPILAVGERGTVRGHFVGDVFVLPATVVSWVREKAPSSGDDSGEPIRLVMLSTLADHRTG